MPFHKVVPVEGEAREAVFGIIIVTHNHRHDIARCLSSLQTAGAAVYGVTVIRDCGSEDGSADVAEEHQLECTVMRGENIGFGRACNEAVAALPKRVTHLLLLNPDTEILFSLGALAEAINTDPRFGPGFGCAGMRQVDAHGTLVWTWDFFPSVSLEWSKAIGRPLLQRSTDGYLRDREVDWVMGSLLVVPWLVFQQYEGFDPRYFLFYEEVDFCHRLRKGGLRVVYLNGFTYRHRQHGKASPWREVVRQNSRQIYDRRWLSPSEAFMCRCAQTIRWLRTLLLPSLSAERRYAFLRILATWGVLEGITSGPSRGQIRIRLRRRWRLGQVRR